MKNQHRPLTFLINSIKLTYLVKYFYTSILIKFVMSCTGLKVLKPRKPIFKKVDFRSISKKSKKRINFGEDSNTGLNTKFWKFAIIVASHEIFSSPVW